MKNTYLRSNRAHAPSCLNIQNKMQAIPRHGTDIYYCTSPRCTAWLLADFAHLHLAGTATAHTWQRVRNHIVGIRRHRKTQPLLTSKIDRGLNYFRNIVGGSCTTYMHTLLVYIHTSRDRTSRPTRFATSHTLSTPYPSCEPSFKSSGQTCSRTTRPHGPKPSEKEAGATQRVKYQGGWGQSCVDCVCMVFDPLCQYLSIRISEVLGDVHLLQCLH